MKETLRIALVGDYCETALAHRAIPVALRLAAERLEGTVAPQWIPTADLSDARRQLGGFHGVWCVPATPYVNMQGALDAIRFAREESRPFLGTCGGFQHTVIEWARNACGVTGAEHAESAPGASDLVITPLECSLVEKRGRLVLAEGSKLRMAYGKAEILEEYHCRYGLNPLYAEKLFAGNLRPVAHDSTGDVRAIELHRHPFFVATLFQPERRALRGVPPPLVMAFLKALQIHGS